MKDGKEEEEVESLLILRAGRCGGWVSYPEQHRTHPYVSSRTCHNTRERTSGAHVVMRWDPRRSNAVDCALLCVVVLLSFTLEAIRLGAQMLRNALEVEWSGVRVVA